MKTKILIVDDDYSFAEFARMLLQSLGYSSVVTLQADMSLAMAVEEKPGLILMDYAMDEMSGVDVIRILKADPRTKDIPIILCSISRSQSEVEKAFEYGAAAFLPKPLSREVLRLTLEKTLGGRK